MRLRILILGLLSISVSAIAADSAATQADYVKTFVQTFYDWYVPSALKQQHGFSYEIVLKQKPGYFNPTLRTALARDLEASQKDPDEIVGLDFDPILASQDPCDHYVVGVVKQVGKSYDADVSCSGERNGKPDLIAEVMQQGNSWIFVNFLYPADGDTPKTDLLTILKNLEAGRDKLKE